jgi:hypothetical protein
MMQQITEQARVKERCPTASHRIQERLSTLDIQDRVELPGKGPIRCIFTDHR